MSQTKSQTMSQDNISKKYQKKSDREHILDNPDTYIGSIELNTTKTYVYNPELEKIIEKDIMFIPGLYKLFDEGIVNSRDHHIRMAEKISQSSKNNNDEINYPVSNINITINDEDNSITLYNDGNGIDVVEHPEHKVWVPELIFGHLRTSTNYDKEEKKIVGGKNGFGFKLVLIWSTWGKIETVDHIRGLKYVQEFSDNLQKIHKPKVTKCKNKPYTSVTFKPDLARLKLSGLDDDFKSLMLKRIYDIAAVTSKNVKVRYNNKILQVKSFADYIDLYIGSKSETERIYEQANDRWEYAVCISPKEEFTQISFVNGIFTAKGGKHVEYITNQLIKKLIAYIKLKKHIDVKPATIKEQLMIFVNSTIVNPAFDSQTKEYLTNSVSNFGSSCEISDKFVEKVAKLGIMNMACSLTELKDNKAAKKTDGAKIRTVRNIPKLVDANYAGTAKSKDCIIILCEGDSAKSGIISGLSREDRNYIGVYPMKGKLLNIRGESVSKIADNKEITEIKQIIGLQNGITYTQDDVAKKLRYGKIVFMTDQDLDGSHIKGLGINLFEYAWRSLINIPNFIGYMNTPILKASKGKELMQFYNNGEYEKWKKTNDISKWNIKYYKGLGTSSSKEFKEYFENRKFVWFNTGDEDSMDCIDKIFNKNRTEDRKTWLSTYNREAYLNTSKPVVTYEEFVDNEFKHYSKYDNDRSIPNLCDGLKVSLRKILYSAFKKNLNTEIKVAQFSGYVSEHSGYHHGEESLNKAIIGLAQNYMGSNNINLFKPCGQLGCVDPNTKVIKWDGSIQYAKNIKINDELIGDDGKKRIVSKVVSGIDTMYKVIYNNNKDYYIVNSQHILTLIMPMHKKIYCNNYSFRIIYYDFDNKTIKEKRILFKKDHNHLNKTQLTYEEADQKMKEFSSNINDNNIIDINIQDYLKLSNYNKKLLFGIYNSKCIEWEYKYVEIDPYILGAWLGDGMSNCCAFASIDHEIIKSWAVWLDTIGCEIIHLKSKPPHENHTFYIRRRDKYKTVAIGNENHNSINCEGCKTSKYKSLSCDWSFNKNNNVYNSTGKNINGKTVTRLNPFKELFKKYNLFKNKHVPNIYIHNSKDIRLNILAGMIDTDGCLKRQNDLYVYCINQCSQRYHLLESFKTIACSLGFKTSIYNNNNNNNMYTLVIRGENINTIPVKVERKKIKTDIIIKKSPYNTSINIEEIGIGEYCGWYIDKNERFLLSDFTITHNTRLHNGSDSASPRYIFTHLSKITRYIYPEVDDNILTYLDDDGKFVEPIYYVPIIPMVLVNGAKGIGTGFSTDIMCYNPVDIINCLQEKLSGGDIYGEIHPYYKGFKGKIIKVSDKKYLIKGLYEILSSDKIKVTELPVGMATQSFKDLLEKVMNDKDKNYIKEYQDYCTDTTVEMDVTFISGGLTKLLNEKHESGIDGVEKYLKLYVNQSTTNMHLFDDSDNLKKYDNVYNIIDDYYDVRLHYYDLRKKYLIKKLEEDLNILSNKARYIQGVLDDTIDLRKKTKEVVYEMLESMKFDKSVDKNNYDYLVKMPMDSVTKENVDKLLKDYENKKAELEKIRNYELEIMWYDELEELKKVYEEFLNLEVEEQTKPKPKPKAKAKSG